MSELRVLIADDHPLFRKGLQSLLAGQPGIEVVGIATNGEEVISLASQDKPDVVLMDLQMPGGGGILSTRVIRDELPDTKVLVVTLFEDDDSIFMALKAGASGYILKDADEEEMIRAIKSVGNGEAIFSPTIASKVLSFFSGTRIKEAKEIFPFLTERERDILYLLTHGRSNADIPRELGLSAKTVSNYVSNVFNKLQVADRAQAIIKAKEAGI